MGQKVNPIGLRLGINRTWDSRWFSRKEYGNQLLDDLARIAALIGYRPLPAVAATAVQFFEAITAGLNGGVGTRVPYEAGAIRLEAFGRYGFEGDLPGVWDLGARVGLSLWH